MDNLKYCYIGARRCTSVHKQKLGAIDTKSDEFDKFCVRNAIAKSRAKRDDMKRRNRIRLLAAERGLTIAELAIAIDMQPHTLRRYSRHEAEPRIELAETIAEYFGVTRDYVIGDENDTKPLPRQVSGQKIPVFGAAQGGKGFDVTDVASPVDMLPTPHYVANASDAYGVFVVGESMEPRFLEGEIVIVHPGKPARRGDWVVVQLQAGEERHAIVKRYKSMSNDHIILEQLNPAREIRHPREDVIALHKIVGVQLTT